ncbi:MULTISPECIES: hypothetical protein [unclassified Cupriavidus]|uniref:hypothetical protein n=1 Tax=Cupriavidus sp. H19C3 TaxID=3241603 RepID=UPI003BF80C1E
MSESASPEGRCIERLEAEAWLDMYAAAPAAYVQRHGVHHRREGAIALLACRGLPSTEFNRALNISADMTTPVPALDAAVAWLSEHGEAWAVQCPPATLADPALRDWLADRQLRPTGTGWAKFTRGAAPPVAVATDMTVRAVEAGQADAFGRVVQAGYGLPAHCATWFAALVQRPRWRTYLACEGSIPVAAAALFQDGDRGWLGVDTTLPGYRRRGAQSALIAARIADGLAAGITAFGAETGNPPAETATGYSSYRNFCRAGFRLAYVRSNFRPA